jgi:hypothetical protein
VIYGRMRRESRYMRKRSGYRGTGMGCIVGVWVGVMDCKAWVVD